jgi:hypothetical protein
MAKSKAEKKAGKELLVRVRKRAKVMMDQDRDMRKLAIQDMKFLRVPGAQWDDIAKKERGNDRPMYEFNKLNVSAKSIINQMRENRPMGKVRAAEDGDVKTADTLEGIIRNIIANADFDTVTDYAAEYQVGGGMGAWRVTVEWAEDSFQQVIDIDPLLNPFCLYCDPSSKDLLKRDAEDWWYTDRISKASFKTRWPKAEQVDIDDDEFDDGEMSWDEDERVRIGEYWYKEPYEKEIALLSDGSVIDVLDEDGNTVTPQQGVTIQKTRKQRCNRIMMCIVSGNAILEGPVEWAGTQHPWIMVFGDYVVIEGQVYWNGITRPGKDAQRAYNYSRTSAIETVALAPQDKPWMTPKQVAGLENLLAEAHKKNYPFNLYNPDPAAPGPPVRQGGPNIPAALVQEMQIASDDIKAVTGIYDASLGAKGNETSGKAINARKQQGEIANFNFMDNMGKGVKRTWEILVDLIPKVFDTETTLRILGADGKESYETVNKLDPATGKVINDLSRGRFDTVITVGPSYATRRMEAAEAYTAMAGQDEGLMLSAGDLVYKAMDLPYAQEIAERRQALLPPPVQKMLTEGKNLPPEVTAAMQQVEQAQASVQQHGQLVQAAQQELQGEMAQAKSEKAGAQLAAANLKAQEANFEVLQKNLDMAQADLDAKSQLLAKETENAILKIRLAEIDTTNKLVQQAHQQDLQHQERENQFNEREHSLNEQVSKHSSDLQNRDHELQNKAMDLDHRSKEVDTKAKEVDTKAKQAQAKPQPKARKKISIRRTKDGLEGTIEEDGVSRAVSVKRGKDGSLDGAVE